MVGTANDLNISEAGIVTFDGTSVFHGRTLTAGTGISISNGNGVSGNPVISSTASTTDLHTATYIVSANGTSGTGANYSTIGSAISAANTAGAKATIFVMPGTYNESFIMRDGINVTAFTCDSGIISGSDTASVRINGSITGPASGIATLSNVEIRQTNLGNSAIIFSGGGTLRMIGCSFLIEGLATLGISGGGGVNECYQCNFYANGTSIKPFGSSSSAVISLYNCTTVNAGTVVACTIAGSSTLNVYNSQILYPITSSSTANLNFQNSTFGLSTLNATCLTIGGTGSNSAYNCRVLSGSGSAISVSTSCSLTLANSSIDSTNTNAITGAGTISLSNVSFTNTSSLINTTTQTPLVSFNDAVKVKTPGAYPYTTVPQDNVILVDTSSARTITPLASPTTGQVHRIKDSVGSAAVNNITITPSGKNIDGAASYVINVAYGSVDIVFGGSEWHVV